MRDGKILQLGDPQTIYTQPANRYVAGFIGSPAINFMDGEIETGGEPVFRSGGLTVPLDRYEFRNGIRPGRATLGIRPEHISVGHAAADEPFRAEAEADIVETMGADAQLWTRLKDHELRARIDGQATHRAGERVPVGFDPARASLFDRETEARI